VVEINEIRKSVTFQTRKRRHEKNYIRNNSMNFKTQFRIFPTISLKR
jgi:hypothetical protein